MANKVFTLTEARSLLPELQQLVESLRDEASILFQLRPHIDRARDKSDVDGGSPYGSTYLTHAFSVAHILEQIEQTGVIVKDFDTGLVDFPFEYEGRIVYLCWKLGESDLLWWHEIEDGFAGRQPIGESFERSN